MATTDVDGGAVASVNGPVTSPRMTLMEFKKIKRVMKPGFRSVLSRGRMRPCPRSIHAEVLPLNEPEIREADS
jgi:hypothetical protein